MKTIQIQLKSIEEANSFNRLVSSYPYEFDLLCGRYIVDAKSIMGIFSLDLKKVITLNIHVEEEDKATTILEALKPYTVE